MIEIRHIWAVSKNYSPSPNKSPARNIWSRAGILSPPKWSLIDVDTLLIRYATTALVPVMSQGQQRTCSRSL